MTGQMSDYEKLRAEMHEELCRMAATFAHIRDRICHFRQCRRRRICSGPMEPSVHQAGQVELQRSLGMSGEACANLPICAACLEPRLYRLFAETFRDVSQMRHDHPDANLWPDVVRAAARRRMRTLTSDPDRPTSGDDTGGNDQ